MEGHMQTNFAQHKNREELERGLRKQARLVMRQTGVSWDQAMYLVDVGGSLNIHPLQFLLLIRHRMTLHDIPFFTAAYMYLGERTQDAAHDFMKRNDIPIEEIWKFCKRHLRRASHWIPKHI